MLKYFCVFVICILSAVAVTGQSTKKAMVFYQSGQKQKETGQFLQAVASFKKAIVLDKKLDSAYLELGNIYLKISRNDSAIMVLKNVLKINPDFNIANITLGHIYRDYLKKSDEAIVHYLNALKKDSLNKVILYSLAWCNNDKGNYREALKYGIKALETDNNYRPAYNELGHAYRQLKAYAEGIEQFKKNIAVSVNEQPLYYSGLCYLELNDKAGAEKMYEELKKINSKSADALRKKIDTKQ